jgi:catechol 2,3-dioxygenase-like lactoylglutathione lyase family enzyme
MPEAQSNAVPPVSIGHVAMTVGDLEASYGFYVDLGLRTIGKSDGMAILELRGGTHLLLFKSGGSDAGGGEGPFDQRPATTLDLMIAGRSQEELTAFRSHLIDRGHAPDPILGQRFFGHYVFKARDPDGNEVTVSTSHASNQPI